MKSWDQLIGEWLSGGTNRTASTLSRGTGIPRNTISRILNSKGWEPSVEVAAKLARVLPREEVVFLLVQHRPELNTIVQLTASA